MFGQAFKFHKNSTVTLVTVDGATTTETEVQIGPGTDYTQVNGFIPLGGDRERDIDVVINTGGMLKGIKRGNFQVVEA